VNRSKARVDLYCKLFNLQRDDLVSWIRLSEDLERAYAYERDRDPLYTLSFDSDGLVTHVCGESINSYLQRQVE